MGSMQYKKRIFIDNAHNYLLRIDEDLFQTVVRIADKRKLSINTMLNEAIIEYVEKNA